MTGSVVRDGEETHDVEKTPTHDIPFLMSIYVKGLSKHWSENVVKVPMILLSRLSRNCHHPAQKKNQNSTDSTDSTLQCHR